MAKKKDENVNVDPENIIIGKGSPYVTKFFSRKIRNEACRKKGFKKVVIEGNIRTIGEHAFLSCRNLTSVEIQNGVKTISPRAFSGCTGLTSVVIPKSVKTIEDEAFAGCTALSSVELPKKTVVSDTAFSKTTIVTRK